MSSVKFNTIQKQERLWQTKKYGADSFIWPVLVKKVIITAIYHSALMKNDIKNRPFNSITTWCRWLLCYRRAKQTEDLFTCLVWLIVQQCLRNKRRYIYLNITPSRLALSADASSLHQKGWLQVQQSGTIKSLLQALHWNSPTQKTESTLPHIPNFLLQDLRWAVHSNLAEFSSIQLTNLSSPGVTKVHKQKAITGLLSWIPVHHISSKLTCLK